MAGHSARLNILVFLLLLSFAASPARAAPGFERQGFDHQGFDHQGFDRQSMRQELMTLPPPERHARMQQLRQQFQQQHTQQMAEKQQQLRDRWNRATPEQRQKFCSNVGSRCGSDGGQPVCQTASQLCGH